MATTNGRASTCCCRAVASTDDRSGAVDYSELREDTTTVCTPLLHHEIINFTSADFRILPLVVQRRLPCDAACPLFRSPATDRRRHCGLLNRRLLPRINGPGPESNRKEGLPPGPRTGSRLLGQVQGKPQIGTTATLCHAAPRRPASQPSTHPPTTRISAERAHEDEHETAHDAHEPKRRTGMNRHDRKTDERKTAEAPSED